MKHAICDWAFSALAQAAGRPWSLRQTLASSSALLFRAADGPTSPAAGLRRVRAPVLLIVGGNDQLVLGLNRRAYALIPAECRIAVVPRAAHLFEEPGAMRQVAELARRWFSIHLASAKNPASQEMSHG